MIHPLPLKARLEGMQSLILCVLCAATRSGWRFRGRWRLIRWLHKHEKDLRRLPETWHQIRDAGWMRLNPAEFVDRHLLIEGAYETEVAEMLRAKLQPGATFVDVGANIGFFTLLASSLVGAAGHLLAIEPAPTALRKLRLHVHANRLKNVTIHGVACIDSPRTVTLHAHISGNAGMTSMRDLGDPRSPKFSVAGECLDRLLLGERRVDLVKIDVEGAELLALKGLERTLRSHTPAVIIELTDFFLRQLGASLPELLSFMEHFGYSPVPGNGGRFDPLYGEQQTVLWQHTSHRRQETPFATRRLPG